MSQGWYRNGGSERSIGIACSMQYLLGQGEVGIVSESYVVPDALHLFSIY
jgi:hypothetical protein